MIIKLLGSAAGGGFPQWNCACPNCRRARSGDPSARPRRNDSLAISPDGCRWILLNASPDVCLQTEENVCLHPGPSFRGSPIQAILLTDAELDHTTGLLGLRQGSSIDVYATQPVLGALADSFPVRRIVEPFANFLWHETKPEESFPLFGGQLLVCPFDLGNKPPRYISAGPLREVTAQQEPWSIGYRITDLRTGGIAVYAPGIEAWSQTLERHLESADCIFLDGTFWLSEELRELGISELRASDMGHLPVAGPGGSAELFARLPARRKVYVHINNTNPMLLEDSQERRTLTDLGIEIGFDGMEMEV
ncbi:pyrroloquinoline quinone biosynthesis protein PqqB [Paenibacillus sp. PR3]|uniref:Coenzyme PQQ synthesis protein B n=1 Tax=Paenibacillus terricola TaxID=2763503 RepID=A0ABR8MSV0_9BACL|nr:pyrroloquinoline quinone biosynthesis protein PqqB [Paenibacillus terricola]MBD3919046.1 pyrroloquinoline quinone biosynthesis protein PqqB [Paenibacillus terricola]